MKNITVRVVGIPSEYSDEIPTNLVTVFYSRLRLENTDGIPTINIMSVGIPSESRRKAVSNFL